MEFTDLVEDCRKAGLRDPVIDDSRTEFVITIWRPDKRNDEDTMTRLEGFKEVRDKIRQTLEALNNPDDAINDAINEAIKLSPGIKRAKLIRIVGKSKATVERCLSSLKEQGKIEYRGSNKTGGYYVVEDN